MSNSTRYYCTRDLVKAAIGIAGAKLNALIDAKIEAASADIEILLGRKFIPLTATKLYPWPQAPETYGVLYPNEDLLAVTALLAKAQDSSPTTIAAADYFLEPNDAGPPYSRIEIDKSSDALFEGGDTSQRSISVAGRWGYCEDTKAAGALAEALDASETEVQVTDSSKVGVGDTLKVESEAMFVSEKALLDTTANVTADLTESKSDVGVAVNDGTKVKQGEVITVGSERMLVESIAGTVLTVERSYDGSVLAAHSQPLDVYAPRSLTVVRGVNGTTAAAHADATAISKYAPPGDIVELCQAEAIAHLKQDESGWTGQIGGMEGGVQVKMVDLYWLRERAKQKYGRAPVA